MGVPITDRKLWTVTSRDKNEENGLKTVGLPDFVFSFGFLFIWGILYSFKVTVHASTPVSGARSVGWLHVSRSSNAKDSRVKFGSSIWIPISRMGSNDVIGLHIGEDSTSISSDITSKSPNISGIKKNEDPPLHLTSYFD